MSSYTSAFSGDQIDALLNAASTGLQPGDVAQVATTGVYADLSGTPDLSALPSAGQKAALNAANAPSASNALATMADVGAGGGGTGDLSATDIDTLSKLNAIVADATLVAEAELTPANYPAFVGPPGADGADGADGEDGIGIPQTATEVPVTLTPDNYSATTQDVEAHLTGIDTALVAPRSSLTLAIGAEPATPPPGHIAFYATTEGLCWKDEYGATQCCTCTGTGTGTAAQGLFDSTGALLYTADGDRLGVAA